MSTRRLLRIVLVSSICTIPCSEPVYSQVPPCVKARSPFPELADEIAEMRAEVEGKSPTVVIDSLNLDGPIRIPRSFQTDLIKKLNQAGFRSGSNWLEEIQNPVETFWRLRGYLKATAYLKPNLISEDPQYQDFSINVHSDVGRQYRLARIQFVNANPGLGIAFPAGELRKMFPIRGGEILSVDKIRGGIAKLTLFYGTRGYMDFTAEPTLETDEVRGRISVLLRLSEGSPYRVEKVEALGLDAEAANDLSTEFRIGDLYNQKIIEAMVANNKSALPCHFRPENVLTVERNIKEATVKLMFDFRTPCLPCPQ